MELNNTVILKGYLGSDPRMLNSKYGQLFAAFTLATRDCFDDENGKTHCQATVWHNSILVFKPELVDLTKFLKKGDNIELTGSLSYKSFSIESGKKTIKKNEASIIAHNFNVPEK